eukprot:6406810-Prymnesium_polylepis.1
MALLYPITRTATCTAAGEKGSGGLATTCLSLSRQKYQVKEARPPGNTFAACVLLSCETLSAGNLAHAHWPPKLPLSPLATGATARHRR